MKDQDYGSHRQYVPLYHFVLTLLVLVSIVGAAVLVYRAFTQGEGRLSAVLILLLAVSAFIAGAFLRIFALKAQDRAIQAEEKLRHYVLYGSLPDARLSIRQIVGLRFASDEEFGDLCKRAAEEGLSENAIKKAIKNWRADGYRV